MASREFGNWLLALHAIIDAEFPCYPPDADRWRGYFNADFTPREALTAAMPKVSPTKG